MKIPKESAIVTFTHKGKFVEISGQLPQPLHVIDGIRFYCNHAIINDKVVMLPLQLKKNGVVQVTHIDDIINFDGYDLDLGELKLIVW